MEKGRFRSAVAVVPKAIVQAPRRARACFVFSEHASAFAYATTEFINIHALVFLSAGFLLISLGLMLINRVLVPAVEAGEL